MTDPSRRISPTGRDIARGGGGSDGGEDGSITLFVAILAVALLCVAGLVYDGGTKLTNARRATDIAAEAARAGADQVNLASLRGQGAPTVDPAAAARAAQAYLTQAGVTGTATPHGTDQVTVTVTISSPTVLLGLLGIGHTTATGTATAELEHGVTKEQP